MKDFYRGLAVITVILLLFPAIPALMGIFIPQKESLPASSEINLPKEETHSYDYISQVYLYDTSAKKEIILTTEEYLVSALAALISPEAEKELLKAQTVLMYTYILGRRLDETASPTPELFGCDISTDTSKYPKLALGKEEPIDREPYHQAVKEVIGEYCAYENQPISVAYCYSSGTLTESAETVLGIDLPYLKSVSTHEPDAFYTTVSYTSDEVFARLSTSESGYVLLGDASGWITPNETEESGYVKSVLLDSRFLVSGIEMARLLNLPSARFTFIYSPATDRFTFTVSGSGSLVGMSQRGAEVLARQGNDYRQILNSFFSQIEIKSSENLSLRS